MRLLRILTASFAKQVVVLPRRVPFLAAGLLSLETMRSGGNVFVSFMAVCRRQKKLVAPQNNRCSSTGPVCRARVLEWICGKLVLPFYQPSPMKLGSMNTHASLLGGYTQRGVLAHRFRLTAVFHLKCLQVEQVHVFHPRDRPRSGLTSPMLRTTGDGNAKQAP